MNFTKESQIVNSYVVLIDKGLESYENVPDIFNLRDAVKEALIDKEIKSNSIDEGTNTKP